LEDNISDDTAKANILNDYFVSVLTDEPPLDSNMLPTEPLTQRLSELHVTQEDIRKKLQQLKANKASGPDNVNVNVLRQCLDLDAPLTLLFNQSLNSGNLPSDWTDAHVTPLFKKGSRSSCKNYRPVSLTSQIVKILERIILDRINITLKANHFIKGCQHGFQQKASCTTQLLECMEDWTRDYDNKKSTDIIYLDFAKAFDKVPHQRLLKKLQNAGIEGKVQGWIRNFLTKRRQKVVLRNGMSQWRRVKSGVPQGSILGPTLFLIYVNDLPDSVTSSIKMFADDAKAYKSICSLADCQVLQNDLDHLADWSKKWPVEFNETKCVVLRLKKAIQFTYNLNSVELQEVENQKDLGVYISNTLHPRHHIKTIVSSAFQRLGLVKRCFTNHSPNNISTLFKSIVRPVLEYGSPVWSPWHNKDIELLEKVQARCNKICSVDLKLPSLKSRRNQTDLIEVYKYVHGMYKTPADTFFDFSQCSLGGHHLKLAKSYSRTDLRKHFFSNRVVDKWNCLPEDVVSAPSLNRLKRALRFLPPD